jgi:hypothetical protein
MDNDAIVTFDGDFGEEHIAPFLDELPPDHYDGHSSPMPVQIQLQKAAEDGQTPTVSRLPQGLPQMDPDFDEDVAEPAAPRRQRLEQHPLLALAPDISGDDKPPTPVPALAERCACCGLHTLKLWQGARTSLDEPHAVCTLCYLTGHLDSPTAAHGRLAYLPALSAADAIHLQRRALLSILAGNDEQQKDGLRIWKWMDRHAREVEAAWGTARAVEFALAMQRLTTSKRMQLQARLGGCALILPADMFDDLSLLLPAGKTAQSALNSYSWDTYTRSDLYVEPRTLG